MKKPDILSNEEVKNIFHLTALGYTKPIIADRQRITQLLKAQRDKDCKEMLEKIGKQIWKSAYISPDNKQKVINGIKQALSQLEEG